MNVNYSALQTEIVADLTVELSDDPAFNADFLAIKVKNAIRDVMQRRNYAVSGYTDEKIADDLYNYYSTISSVARYDYNQRGIEGETSHTENGVSRGFTERDNLFRGVHAFVDVL